MQAQTDEDTELVVALLFISLPPKKYLVHFMFFFYQEFKVLLLSFAVFVAAISAAKACKCEDNKGKSDTF